MYQETTHRSILLLGGWIPGRKKPGRTAGVHGYPAGRHKCQRWPHWWENPRESTSRRRETWETSGKPGTVLLVDHPVWYHFKYSHVMKNEWNIEAFTCTGIFIYQVCRVCKLFSLIEIHLIMFSHSSWFLLNIHFQYCLTINALCSMWFTGCHLWAGGWHLHSWHQWRIHFCQVLCTLVRFVRIVVALRFPLL